MKKPTSKKTTVSKKTTKAIPAAKNKKAAPGKKATEATKIKKGAAEPGAKAKGSYSKAPSGKTAKKLAKPQKLVKVRKIRNNSGKGVEQAMPGCDSASTSPSCIY